MLKRRALATADYMQTGDDRMILVVISAIMIVYYGLLLTDGHFNILHPTSLGLIFNNMLLHMLDGQFDIDPTVIGNEAFVRDGRTYAYWGIFGALLRVPLLVWPRAINTDITGLSCLAGVCIGGFFKLRSLLLVTRHSTISSDTKLLVGAVGAWLFLGGAQTGFLLASIYQEVMFWSGAMAAVFVYVAIRGLLRQQFSTSSLSVMAAMAGLSVNTRVSMGIGLYAALGLLLVVLLYEELSRAGDARPWIVRLYRAALQRRTLIALAILLVFVIVAGIVNAGRFGNPLTFADYRHHLGSLFPGHMERLQNYGLFNLERVPFGLIYYFFPIWVLRGADGNLMLDEYRYRLIDVAELPPASFLLTEMLPILLMVLVCWRTDIFHRWKPRLSQGFAIATGLAAPGGLMLTAMGMTYRYRMDFLPLLEFVSFLAIPCLSREYAVHRMARGLRISLVVATIVGIVAAHVILVLYKLSPLGPGQMHLHEGIVNLYHSAALHKLIR